MGNITADRWLDTKNNTIASLFRKTLHNMWEELLQFGEQGLRDAKLPLKRK